MESENTDLKIKIYLIWNTEQRKLLSKTVKITFYFLIFKMLLSGP